MTLNIGRHDSGNHSAKIVAKVNSPIAVVIVCCFVAYNTVVVVVVAVVVVESMRRRSYGVRRCR